MPLIPLVDTARDGTFIQSASREAGSISGNVSGVARKVSDSIIGQVSGRVQKEISSFTSGNVISGAVRSINAETGGLLQQASERFGIAQGVPGVDGAVGQVLGKIAGFGGGVSPQKKQWGNLNTKLLARIYPLDNKFKEVFDTAGGAIDLLAPLTETQLEIQLNWQSPFENSGPESKAPTLMAMLQTGQLSTVANSIQALLPKSDLGKLGSDVAKRTASWAQDLQGRTGITKLNSRQVFSGMPPIRITGLLHFRAMSNALSELMVPYQRLLSWALPQKLAQAGVLNEIISETASGQNEFIKAMFPSKSPTMVGFTYGNNRYAPMVIESMGHPLDGPMDSNGIPIYRSVQITLATLTALDRNDVPNIFARS